MNSTPSIVSSALTPNLRVDDRVRVRSTDGASPTRRGAEDDSAQRVPAASDNSESSHPQAVSPASSRPHGDAESLRTSLNELKETMAAVREKLDIPRSHELRIEYDKELSRYIVAVIDPETDETVRQIPPEEFIETAQRLQELRGVLFDEKS